MTETNVFALTAALHIALRINTQQNFASGSVKLVITKHFVRKLELLQYFCSV